MSLPMSEAVPHGGTDNLFASAAFDPWRWDSQHQLPICLPVSLSVGMSVHLTVYFPAAPQCCRRHCRYQPLCHRSICLSQGVK
jgi:hypothetical protein